MNFRNILPVIAVFAVICLTSAYFVQAQGMPHAIIGVVRDAAGAPVPGASVTLTNSRTGEKLTATSDAQGQYQADLTTMPSGYQVGDVIRVKAASGNLEGSGSVAVSGNAFDQCDIVLGEKTISLEVMLVTAAIPIIIVIAAAVFFFGRKPEKVSRKGRRRK